MIIVDNGRYGTIRMHQERDFPCRTVGTDIQSPDFAAVARGFGLEAQTISTTDAFKAAFDTAVATGQPHLLHLLPDPRAVAPGRSL